MIVKEAEKTRRHYADDVNIRPAYAPNMYSTYGLSVPTVMAPSNDPNIPGQSGKWVGHK